MWDKSPELFADLVTRAAVTRVQNVSVDCLEAVAYTSPIDTSRFSSNNRVAIGTRGNEYDENDFSGPTTAIARGVSAIRSMPKNKLQDVEIYNLTPYSIYLEDTMRYRGSRQAPNGVYRVSFIGVTAFYR